MRTRPLDREGTDRGFTLPELLISIVVMGTIAPVLIGVFAVFMRSTPGAEARADDARSVMGLVTWLPQDVDSTPATGFDDDASTSSGCDQSPGINLLRMDWTEKIGSVTTTYIAAYRHVSDVDAARVVRITCSGVGSPPFATATQQNLTSDLPLLPVGWTKNNAPAAVNIIRTNPLDPTSTVELVTFELTTLAGDVVRTDSASKNPADTLPATTLPSWIPPTPITVPNVNHLPTTVEPKITAWPGPAKTIIKLSVNDVDGDPLVVALDSVPSGWVVTLVGTQMTITPAAADVGQIRKIKYTVDDLQGDGIVNGEVEVTVVPSTTPTTTTTTTTTTIPSASTLPPCAVTSASVSPNSVKNVPAEGNGNGSVNVGVLFKSVVVSASTNGNCIGLEIHYDTDGVNTTGFLILNKIGPTSWSGTLLSRNEGSSETWSDGSHSISFHDAGGGPYATTTLTII